MNIPVEDRLAIQELAAEYSFRCNTRRFDTVHELFAADCYFDETALGVPAAQGLDGVRGYFGSFGGAESPVEWFIHINSNHRLTAYGGNTAAGTLHLHGEGRLKGRGSARVFGYMDDEYVKVGGKWLFRKRVLVEIAPVVWY